MFVAKIDPYGKVNPALYETIEWYVAEIKVGDEEDVLLSETYAGNGASFVFSAPHGGDFDVVAKLTDPYDDKPFEVKQRVHVEYLPYFAGEVKVTIAGEEKEGIEGAPSKGTIYSDKKITFGLTGIEYVDQTVGIKWFVNGEEVLENGELYLGATFTFEPKKAGTYVISAQYGERQELGNEFRFVLEVKPAVSNPLYISLIVVGGVIVIAAVVTIVLVVLKKRTKASFKEEE